MASHREGDEDYGKIIAVFSAKNRLIECADGIQWILQLKRGKEWKSVKFFTSRDGVLRRVREYGLPLADALEVLPERHKPVADWSLGLELPFLAIPLPEGLVTSLETG